MLPGQVTAAVALHHGGGGAGGCSTGGGDGGGGLGGEGGGCGAELSMEGQVSAPPGLAKRSGSAPAERLMIRGGGGGSEDAGCSTAAEAGGCSGSTVARRPRQEAASINVPAEAFYAECVRAERAGAGRQALPNREQERGCSTSLHALSSESFKRLLQTSTG